MDGETHEAWSAWYKECKEKYRDANTGINAVSHDHAAFSQHVAKAASRNRKALMVEYQGPIAAASKNRPLPKHLRYHYDDLLTFLHSSIISPRKDESRPPVCPPEIMGLSRKRVFIVDSGMTSNVLNERRAGKYS